MRSSQAKSCLKPDCEIQLCHTNRRGSPSCLFLPPRNQPLGQGGGKESLWAVDEWLVACGSGKSARAPLPGKVPTATWSLVSSLGSCGERAGWWAPPVIANFILRTKGPPISSCQVSQLILIKAITFILLIASRSGIWKNMGLSIMLHFNSQYLIIV